MLRRLVDVSKDLATDVLATGLLVVHDTSRGGEDHLAERTGGEEEGNPVLDGVNGNVEAGRDNTGLVEATVELDDDLAATVVVNDLELADVACRMLARVLKCRSRGPRIVCQQLSFVPNRFPVPVPVQSSPSNNPCGR